MRGCAPAAVRRLACFVRPHRARMSQPALASTVEVYVFYFDVVGFVDEFLEGGEDALERLRNFHVAPGANSRSGENTATSSRSLTTSGLD
jgi:hypothetical protein